MSDGEEQEIEDVDGASEPTQDPAFPQLLDKLNADHAFDFRQYKEASLYRRVRRRMAQVNADSVDAYMKYLDTHAGEHVALFNTILINVTRFFRDQDAWAVLRAGVLPDLIAHARDTHILRFWTAGCSSGEEPYSLAILVADALRGEGASWDVKIYSTDIDEEALASARAGLYRLEHVKNVPNDLLQRSFVADGQAYRVRRDIRKWCIFGRHDLTRDAPLSHIDLLVCRNVLIYFDGSLQRRVLPQFEYATRDGGYVFLGRSESMLAASGRFEPVDLKWRIFRRASGRDRRPGERWSNDAPQAPAFGGAREQPALGLTPVLDAVSSAVVVIDAMETVIVWNAAAERLFETPANGAIARKFRDLDVSYRVDGLRARVEDVRTKRTRIQMDDVVFARRAGDMAHVDLSVAAVLDDRGRVGVVIVANDTSEYGQLREELDRLAEQSATANEELQSTNEELETTNEELQSTNEELETTNEELQSTNEELETTVQELQSLNTELATLNLELERRTAELNRMDDFQRRVFEAIRAPLFVLDAHGVVTAWNESAATMWGLRPEAAIGREFGSLPIGELTRIAGDPLRRLKETRSPERVGPIVSTPPGGGEWRTFLELAPVLSSIGELIGVLGFTGDKAAE